MEEQPKQPITTRQVKMLMINPQDFIVLFTKGLKVRGGYKVVKGVPKDAKILSVAYEPARGGIMLIVESSEYTAIPSTTMPPIEQVSIELSGRHIKKPS